MYPPDLTEAMDPPLLSKPKPQSLSCLTMCDQESVFSSFSVYTGRYRGIISGYLTIVYPSPPDTNFVWPFIVAIIGHPSTHVFTDAYMYTYFLTKYLDKLGMSHLDKFDVRVWSC